MTRPVDARIALVIGPKGSGKSSLVKAGLAKVARWVVWDLRGEYAELDGARLWHDVRDFAKHLEHGGRVEREVFACDVAQFDAWCTWLFRAGNLLAVVEEVGRYCTAGAAPRPLQDLFDRNRHAGIDLIAVGPRIAQVPKGLAHQLSELVVFRQTLPNDLKYLSDWLGPKAAEAIRQLPDHHFIRFRT